jgi:hypothetical protein
MLNRCRGPQMKVGEMNRTKINEFVREIRNKYF